MKRALLGVGASAALMAGAGCSAASPDFATNQPSMETAFNTVRDYWASRHVPEADKVRLVTVASGSVACTTGVATRRITSSDTATAAYCEKEKLIVVAEQSYLSVASVGEQKQISAADISAVVVAHEFGHHVIRNLGYAATDNIRNELTADCLAGAVLSDTSPSTHDGAVSLLIELGGDSMHGTGEQRVEAFNSGFYDPHNACSVILNLA